MHNFILKVNGKTVIPDDTDHLYRTYSGKPGKHLKEVKSSIAESYIKLLWPDDADDMKYLEEWVNNKINRINKGRNITLAYDSESVCLQFGEVFTDSFDLFKWKKGTPIPKIETNDGIIVFFYNRNDDEKNLKACDILRPLLENKRVTILTFDLTMDLQVLLKFGINANRTRMIDAQLLSTDKNADEFISTVNNTGLDVFIKRMKNKDSLAIRAIKQVKEGEKNFPHSANKFLIQALELKKTAVVSEEFLNYSANDIFLTALMVVEIMTQNELDFVIEQSKKKIQQFDDYYNKYKTVTLFRQAEYSRINHTVITEGSIQDTDRTEQLLSRWNEIKGYHNCIKANIDLINDRLHIDQTTKEIVERKLETVTRILKESLYRVKALAILANPNPKGEEEDDTEDGVAQLDDLNMF
jgi:hypothetical protein